MKQLGLAIAVMAAPAMAQTAPSTAPSPTLKDETKVCKRVEQTGSRMSAKRVCHTADEWQAIERAAGDSGGSNLRSKSN